MVKIKKVNLSKKHRSNKTRSNKTRSNKTRLNKKQKGGVYRGTMLPTDIVNSMRDFVHGGESLTNNIKGLSVSPSPYPTLDHPIDNSIGN